MDNIKSAKVRYLERPDGRIAYEVEGDGPLVVAVPGMGDLRSSFREVVGALRPLGYRVATMDLRGHGDSDTSFHVHGDIVTGQDLLALIDELGGPATVLGNSMGVPRLHGPRSRAPTRSTDSCSIARCFATPRRPARCGS